MVEFALVIGLFLVMIAGTIELSTLLYRRSKLQTATQAAINEVARDRTIAPIRSDILREVQERALAHLKADSSLGVEGDITFEGEVDCAAGAGEWDRVQLTGSWRSKCLLCWAGLAVELHSNAEAMLEISDPVDCAI